MKFLDVAMPTAAENIALDEALLEEAESSTGEFEVLRLWESPEVAVVIGRSSRANQEVDLASCDSRGIPLLRRCSGGAAVVIGRGCLMYSVILSYARRPSLRRIDNAHRLVMGQLLTAIGELSPSVRADGTSDLVVGSKKFSGNSLRCKRQNLLYHGTLLYDFPLELIGECLRIPPRQPAYRCDRSHDEFVTNLPVPVARLREVIRSVWDADTSLVEWPQLRTAELMVNRYALAEWHLAR